jgi:predicted ribosomally synthesized peptide with SipW-like signal peptide
MKKKIFAIVLCVAMLAIAVIGGTMAYFTDTDAQTNTFTAGKVDISLDEAIVEKNAAGNLVATGSRTDETQTLQNYHLFPAMSITKDPTITVAADSEDAYIAAIVTITGDIYDLIGVAGYDNIDITKLASGGLMAKASTQVQGWNGLSMVYETDDCVIYQDADKANNTWTLYIFMKAAQVANAKVVLFDTLTIPSRWDNAEMAKINGMNIVVNAYATQTNGFADCYTAITTAFDSAFAAVK